MQSFYKDESDPYVVLESVDESDGDFSPGYCDMMQG